MKIILALLIGFALVIDSFGTTLIFKDYFITKGGLEYAGGFGCAGYGHIKISIISKNNKYPKSIRIIGAQRGVPQDITLDSQDNLNGDYLKLINLPPSRVSIYIDGADGNYYKINVWGIE